MIKHKRLLTLSLEQRTLSIENEVHELCNEFSSLSKLVPELSEVLDKATQIGDRTQTGRKIEQLRSKELEIKFESLLAEKESLREQDRITLQKALEQVESKYNDLLQQFTRQKRELERTMTRLNTASIELATLKSKEAAHDVTSTDIELQELQEKIAALETSLSAERREKERLEILASEAEQRLRQESLLNSKNASQEIEAELKRKLNEIEVERKRQIEERHKLIEERKLLETKKVELLRLKTEIESKQEKTKPAQAPPSTSVNSIRYHHLIRRPSYSTELGLTIPGTKSVVACGLRVWDRRVDERGDPQVMEIWARQLPQPKISWYLVGNEYDTQKALPSKALFMTLEDLPDQPIELKTSYATVYAWITQLKLSDGSAKQSFESITVVFDVQR